MAAGSLPLAGRVPEDGPFQLRAVDALSRAALIERARAGEEAAFTRLIEELAAPAYRLALAMLHDRQSAEDAVQEATLKAWRKIGSLREGTTSARPWFLAIVANQCRSIRRTRWFRTALTDTPEGSVAPFESRLVATSDLRRAVARLPADQRLALALFFYLDLPLDEVARVLGISREAAKSRIYRATRSLRPGLRESEIAL